MYAVLTLFLSPSALAGVPQPEVVYNAPIAPDAEYAEDQVIIGFREASLPAEIQLGDLRLLRDEDIYGQDAAVYLLPDGADVRDVVARLRRSGRYLYAEPNYVLYPQLSPSDTYYSYQWGVDLIDVEDAWDISTGGRAAIAIIDTGVTSGSNDGLNVYWGGYDYIDKDWDPKDTDGHGSAVASIIDNVADNGKGIAGIAHGAPIRSYRIAKSTTGGLASDVASAIGLAVWEDVQVINLSLGTYSYSSALASAATSAYAAGVFVAAASGNDGYSTLMYPAGLPGVVAVGAVTMASTRPSYSNYGSTSYGGKLDLVAPGGNMDEDLDGDGLDDGIIHESFDSGGWSFFLADGTSMAVPHVSSAASILMSMGATSFEAEDCLLDTAKDLGTAGYDSQYGYGLIQIEDALICFLAWESVYATSGSTFGSWTVTSSDRYLGADVDGDGRHETFSYAGSSWRLQEYSGTGLTTTSYGGYSGFTYAPFFGDFDGDGKDELVVRDATYFYQYKFSGSTASLKSKAAPGSWKSATTDKLVVGDFDGDGADEVFVSSGSAAQLLDYSSSTGKWSSTKSWTTKIGASSSWTLSSADKLVAGDLDGDGYDELFVANASSATLLDDARSWTKLFATSSSTTGMSALWTVASGDQWMAGDVDGDGTDSLMVTKGVSLEVMNYGSGAWTSEWSEDTGIVYWWSLGTTNQWLLQDLDADGRDDLQAFSSGWYQAMSYLN